MIIKNPLYVKMGTDVSDTTATAADVLAGKEFYLADGTKATGQIVTYSGSKNITPTEQSQTLSTQDKYVDGDIVVASIPIRYKDTTGTDAVAGDMLAGKKAVTGAGMVTGSIPTYSGASTVTQNGTLGIGGKYVEQDIEIAVPSQTPTLITKNITANGTYNASSDNADGYSSVTVAVPATPAAPIAESDVNFYDYDGTLVASYTAADFANLTAMPANPSHTGLVAEGWNFTLADAKTYVASYGKLNIWQMYHTASGKTEYDIEVNEATGMTATLSGTSGTEKDWGDGTTDTLENHTYAAVGSYTIKLSGTTLPSIKNSKKVRAVRIANGVTSIGDSAFYGCYALQSVTIPNSVTNIEAIAFNSCHSLQSVTIPNSVTSIGASAFRFCHSLQSVTIPSSVTSVGNTVFYYCYSLRSVNISSSVTNIGTGMFNSCYPLQSVTIPNSVTSVGNTMFYYCYSLRSVNISSSVTNIGSSMFNSCYPLQSVTIPNSVTSIGTSAFASCSWLTIVTVLATTPPTVSSNSFPSNVTKIYIPHGTLATYQAGTNWSTYASKLVELPA